MGRLVLFDAVGAAILLGAWFFYFTRYNRRKGAMALRWVESACSTKGRIVEATWLSITLLQARVGFASHWFDNARVTIRLRPRPIPFKWFVSAWHKQKETLTFEADLGCAPGFQLDVFRHRWLSQKHRKCDWRLARLVDLPSRTGGAYHPNSLDPGAFTGGEYLNHVSRPQPY